MHSLFNSVVTQSITEQLLFKSLYFLKGSYFFNTAFYTQEVYYFKTANLK